MDDLSPRQRQILDFIRREVATKGYPPSVREVGQAVGLSSSSTVHGHLNKLEERGYIRRDPTKPRAIELLDKAMPIRKDVTYAPVLGKVTAGKPILAVENIEDFFPVPSDLANYEEVFMLKVRGESMIQAGILDGDYVVVRSQSHAESGDIVVALIEDEATVKRFFHEGDQIRLQPENDAMEPIVVADCTILGKVIGLFRKM
ncbi:MAG: transcriptional repressor LexA [Firmicutes bacterium]|nr:transcriptional repressor LexA [Bacillota bacterium]